MNYSERLHMLMSRELDGTGQGKIMSPIKEAGMSRFSGSSSAEYSSQRLRYEKQKHGPAHPLTAEEVESTLFLLTLQNQTKASANKGRTNPFTPAEQVESSTGKQAAAVEFTLIAIPAITTSNPDRSHGRDRPPAGFQTQVSSPDSLISKHPGMQQGGAF